MSFSVKRDRFRRKGEGHGFRECGGMENFPRIWEKVRQGRARISLGRCERQIEKLLEISFGLEIKLKRENCPKGEGLRRTQVSSQEVRWGASRLCILIERPFLGNSASCVYAGKDPFRRKTARTMTSMGLAVFPKWKQKPGVAIGTNVLVYTQKSARHLNRERRTSSLISNTGAINQLRLK